MSNIKDKYRIKDYTVSILDGLGYKVVLGDGIQGVKELRDKENQELIPCDFAKFIDVNVCSYYPDEWDCGVATNIYTGKNGEEIYLEEYGKTTIKYNNYGLEINIYKSDGIIIICIHDKKNSKRVYIQYEGYNGEYNEWYRNYIKVNTNEQTVLNIHQKETEWGDYDKDFSVDQLTADNITSIIVDKIKNFNEGSYLSEGLKKGIEIVAPAIGPLTEYFKSEFISFLKSQKESKKQEQRNIMDMISRYEAMYNDHQERIDLYEKTISSLEQKNSNKLCKM